MGGRWLKRGIKDNAIVLLSRGKQDFATPDGGNNKRSRPG